METLTRLLLVTLQCPGSLFLAAQKENIAFSIKGENLFCTTSKNYYIENLPKGATVKWKATPKSIVEITSPNFPQTTLSKVVDGKITLSATVTSFRDTAILKKIVTVGNPFPREHYIFPLIRVTILMLYKLGILILCLQPQIIQKLLLQSAIADTQILRGSLYPFRLPPQELYGVAADQFYK